MASRTTVQILTGIATAIDARRRDEETRSSRFSSDLKSYYALLEAGFISARRILTKNEVRLILDAQKDTLIAEPCTLWLGGALVQKIEDACDLDGRHVAFDVDRDAILGKLRALGDLGCIALVDWAARMWDAHGDDEAWAAGIGLFRSE